MITGHPAGPGRVGVSACDIACGMAAHAGVLEALIERGITGRGKGLKVSLFDGMADWMNVPLLFYEGTGTRTGAAWPGASVDLSLWRIRHRRRCAGADLHPERTRVGGVLREVPRRSGVAATRGFPDQRHPRREPRDGGCAYRACIRASVARRRPPRNCAPPIRHTVSSTTWRHSRTIRHCGARRCDTPNGPVSLAAPPVLFSDGPRAWVRCRRSANTPPRSAPSLLPEAIHRCAAAAAERRGRSALPDRHPVHGRAASHRRQWAA